MNPQILAEYVDRTISRAPQLTSEQREQIARLLKPGASAAVSGGGRR